MKPELSTPKISFTQTTKLYGFHSHNDLSTRMIRNMRLREGLSKSTEVKLLNKRADLRIQITNEKKTYIYNKKNYVVMVDILKFYGTSVHITKNS